MLTPLKHVVKATSTYHCVMKTHTLFNRSFSINLWKGRSVPKALKSLADKGHYLWLTMFSKGFSRIEFSKAVPIPNFYNRHTEIAFFNTKLGAQPKAILVVVGPPNTGKSNLLLTVLREKMVTHIDLRSVGPIRNVDRFIETLAGAFNSMVSTYFTKTTTGIASALSVDWHGLVFAPSKLFAKPSLAYVLTKITQSIEALSRAGITPVIFIDEANNLKYLLSDPNGESVLKDFLDWGVKITKQQGLCHIVMASSDGLWREWLDRSFGLKEYLEPLVIGDITDAEAKKYLAKLLPQLVTENDFALVVSSLGGRMKHLQQFSETYTKNRVVQDVIDEIVSRQSPTFQLALTPEIFLPKNGIFLPKNGRGVVIWTPGMFWISVTALLNSQDGYLPASTLKRMGVPFNVLESLVSYEILSYRPVQTGSFDFPTAKAIDYPILTFPSRASALAVRKLVASHPVVLTMVVTLEGTTQEVALYDCTLKELVEQVTKVFGIADKFCIVRKDGARLSLKSDLSLLALRNGSEVEIHKEDTAGANEKSV